MTFISAFHVVKTETVVYVEQIMRSNKQKSVFRKY